MPRVKLVKIGVERKSKKAARVLGQQERSQEMQALCSSYSHSSEEVAFNSEFLKILLSRAH